MTETPPLSPVRHFMHPEAALPLQCTQQQHLNCLICLEPHTALPTCFHRCELIATHIGTHTNMHTCTHARNSLVLSYQTDTARILSLSFSQTPNTTLPRAVTCSGSTYVKYMVSNTSGN